MIQEPQRALYLKAHPYYSIHNAAIKNETVLFHLLSVKGYRDGWNCASIINELKNLQSTQNA